MMKLTTRLPGPNLSRPPITLPPRNNFSTRLQRPKWKATPPSSRKSSSARRSYVKVLRETNHLEKGCLSSFSSPFFLGDVYVRCPKSWGTFILKPKYWRKRVHIAVQKKRKKNISGAPFKGFTPNCFKLFKE